MRFMRLAVLCGATAAICACHDDGLDNHSCPIDYHGGWNLFAIVGEHTEPRQCPVFITEPTVLRTGATFVDQFNRDVDEVYLLVRNAAGQPKTNGKTVVFGTGSGGRWVAPIYEEYAAGTTGPLRPDVALFDLYAGTTLMADAEMHITYTDALAANISGPVYTLSGQTYTWSANVTQGVPPYSYRWYNDWELISTASSITDYGGDMHLRLDVIDSRGHGVSKITRVTSSDCTGSELEC